MDASEPAWRSCRLQSRHWIIESGSGETEHVIGPGVIGLYPVLRPGQPAFAYQSGVSFSTPSGAMQGEFTMELLDPPPDRSAIIVVHVPRFVMAAPRSVPLAHGRGGRPA